jgi:predicted nucleic acid-binding protein
MRTTLTIDDDVLAAAKGLAARQHQSVGEVISALARQALRPTAGVRETRKLPGHVFWADDISLLDAGKFDLVRLLNASQVTDSYLLALACSHVGKLATFDRRLAAGAVVNCAQGLHLIQ